MTERGRVFATRELSGAPWDEVRALAELEVWAGDDAPPREVLLAEAARADGLVVTGVSLRRLDRVFERRCPARQLESALRWARWMRKPRTTSGTVAALVC